jgi:hypothetical protein|nr:MAG TPA: hypothetical protein [Caudoviricetes sp.]
MKNKIISTLDEELLYMSSSELNYYFTHGWSIYWIETRVDNVKCAVTRLYRSKDRLLYVDIKAALEARASGVEVISIVERRQWKKN